MQVEIMRMQTILGADAVKQMFVMLKNIGHVGTVGLVSAQNRRRRRITPHLIDLLNRSRRNGGGVVGGSSQTTQQGTQTAGPGSNTRTNPNVAPVVVFRLLMSDVVKETLGRAFDQKKLIGCCHAQTVKRNDK